jgi:Fe-S oxidoreductase
MAHNKENALCCGFGAQDSYPNISKKFRRQVLDEAKETGAKI